VAPAATTTTTDPNASLMTVLQQLIQILEEELQQLILQHQQQTPPPIPSPASASFIPRPTAGIAPLAVVSGMSQYTDPDFGFSFWYPSGWKVTSTSLTYNPMAETGAYADYPDGVTSKILKVSNGDPNNTMGVEIDEFSSPDMSITDICTNCVAEKWGVAVRYYFDTSLHTWMEQDGDAGLQNPTTPKLADVSTNTMGGLHMLPGGQRFQNDTIIPLSANNFLIVNSLDLGNPNRSALIKTVVATDPKVATPMSVAQQEATIRAEAAAYANTN
jgi:hypothetical protein